MQVQGVTDIVESQAMGQLGKEQRDDVTPGQVGPRFLIDPSLPRQLGGQVGRNEIAELAQDGEGRPRWLPVLGSWFHTPVPCGAEHAGSQLLFARPSSHCGMAVKEDQRLDQLGLFAGRSRFEWLQD